MRHGTAQLAIGGLLGAAVALTMGTRGRAGAMRAPEPCTAPEYRQFDFFAGDWDAYDVTASAKLVARNKVDLILGGCVLHEVYRQTDSLVGESFSIYDASRGRWHQSWVTNHGALLLLDGGLEGGRMALTATEKASDGTPSLLRGVWRREGTAVRETAERSADGGKTWTPVFDLLFRPHGSH
jgi:hypothetical protein